MSMTVSALVDEVTETFRSYVREQNPTSALTSSIDSDDLSFTVADATQVGKGLHQIEDEMVWVRSVDRTTSTVTLEPWGRAQSGSTAASHASGVRITQAPTYPRSRVRDLISGVLQEIFPDLFSVDSVTLDITAAQVNYSLPSDVYEVLSVSFQPVGPSLSWVPMRRWRQNKTPTAVEMEILTRVTPGNGRVRVFYKKNPPGQLVFTDDLQALGYPTSIRDVIVLGATARLAAFTETSRVQTNSLEGAARADFVPAGSALTLSKYLYGLFRQRLMDEAQNLQNRYPVVLHFTR